MFRIPSFRLRRALGAGLLSLSLGLGLMQVPEAMQHMSGTMKALLGTGLLPAAVCAIVLNLIVPESKD